MTCSKGGRNTESRCKSPMKRVLDGLTQNGLENHISKLMKNLPSHLLSVEIIFVFVFFFQMKKNKLSSKMLIC